VNQSMKKLYYLFVTVMFLGFGCTTTTVPTKVDPNVGLSTLSLQKLVCEGCGARVVRVLKRQKGIQKLSFDKHKVELQVSYSKKDISEKRVMQLIKNMGFLALQGAGKGAYKPSAKFTSDLDVKWIAKKGEAVNLKDHLAPNKVTVFDFYATWCGPCKDVDHALLKLMKKNPNVALRKINIVDWDKPVVKKYMAGVSTLPYLIIYDKKGNKAQVIAGRKLELMIKTINKLSK